MLHGEMTTIYRHCTNCDPTGGFAVPRMIANGFCKVTHLLRDRVSVRIPDLSQAHSQKKRTAPKKAFLRKPRSN